MHKLLELILPSWAEVALYSAIGFFGLILLNVSTLWRSLLQSSGVDVATATAIDESLRQTVREHTTLSDPQVVNGVVWAATAALGVCVALAITGFIRSENQDLHGARKRGGAVFLFERLVARAGALACLVIAAILLFVFALPQLSHAFVVHITEPIAQWYNVPLAIACCLGAGVCVYVLAVLARLVALRVRVFSAVID
jgi:hypothetical protein